MTLAFPRKFGRCGTGVLAARPPFSSSTSEPDGSWFPASRINNFMLLLAYFTQFSHIQTRLCQPNHPRFPGNQRCAPCKSVLPLAVQRRRNSLEDACRAGMTGSNGICRDSNVSKEVIGRTLGSTACVAPAGFLSSDFTEARIRVVAAVKKPCGCTKESIFA